MNRVFFMLLVAAISFMTGIAFKAIISKQNNETTEMKNANKQLDEELIRKVEAAYDRAWKEGDVGGVVACLTKDALLINPRGEVATGHNEIRDLLSKFLDGPAKGSTHTSRVTLVNFVTNDVAVVDGEALIEGMEFADSATLTHRFTDILVRSGDVWLIAQVRAYANY
jgi:uncharacterized protein (TIGR02246 family)